MQSPSDRQQAIWLALASIPRGRVVSYGQLAQLAGLPGRARLVGQVLSKLPRDSKLPWHRVLNAQGRLSLPTGSVRYAEQRRRLEDEGIIFIDDRINLKSFAWQP